MTNPYILMIVTFGAQNMKCKFKKGTKDMPWSFKLNMIMTVISAFL